MKTAAEHPRISREKRTVEAMIGIYCRDRHGAREHGALCEECTELLDYARLRLDRCRYAEKKPTCGNCPVHCYKPSMKAKIQDVMRYSGPRMTFRHPYFALRHFMDGFVKAPERPAAKTKSGPARQSPGYTE